jgi:hypothetical protein
MLQVNKNIRLYGLFIAVLIFNASLPIVSSVHLNQGNPLIKPLNNELPDLVGSVELFEEGGQTWYNYSITNIGDAAADHFNVTVTLYPFGTFLLRNTIWLFLIEYLPPTILDIIAISLDMMGIFPFFMRQSRTDSWNPLLPGETDVETSWGPFDVDFDKYFNSRVCMILECVADPDNEIKESNEMNNRDVIRWWFPLKTQPPANKLF